MVDDGSIVTCSRDIACIVYLTQVTRVGSCRGHALKRAGCGWTSEGHLCSDTGDICMKMGCQFLGEWWAARRHGMAPTKGGVPETGTMAAGARATVALSVSSNQDVLNALFLPRW